MAEMKEQYTNYLKIRGLNMLIDEVKAQSVQARKDRNHQLAQLLITFYSEAAMIGKNDGERPTTDEEVQKVAKKFIGGAKDVIENLPAGDERVEAAQFEIDVLEGFLPQQLSEEELGISIGMIIEGHGLTSVRDMGTIMKELNKVHAGRFDGSRASAIAKEIFAMESEQ
jgi:uncharacterized protein YqeY